MQLTNSSTHYGLLARLLHWSNVALLLTLIGTASAFEDLDDSPDKLALVMRHASWGLLLLSVMSVRLAWRLANHNPVSSYAVAAWQKAAARGLHWCIYVVIITQCGIGIDSLVTDGSGMSFFGWFEIPPLMQGTESMHKRLADAHVLVANAIYPLFALHIAAAIYHQVFGVLDEGDTASPGQ